jgi:hypothetical protein
METAEGVNPKRMLGVHRSMAASVTMARTVQASGVNASQVLRGGRSTANGS